MVFFATGVHGDSHQVTDEPQPIDCDKEMGIPTVLLFPIRDSLRRNVKRLRLRIR